MAAAQLCFLLALLENQSSPASMFHVTTVYSFTLVLFVTLLICILSLYSIIKRNDNRCGSRSEEDAIKIQSLPGSDCGDGAPHLGEELGQEAGAENLGRSVFLEVVPPNSAKWETLFGKIKDFDNDTVGKNEPIQDEKKRRKKKLVKDKILHSAEEGRKERDELICLYPFTKSCSAIQRKIKQQYDQLVKSHGSKGLTLDQIGQFVNCLIEAKNELQHKSEVIKRKFTITKALLFKADRSTFDRLRQQIYKLELEQKRLDEDTLVYNWLQEQLKASPAYKKMLEIGECMEMEAKSNSLEESGDAEFSDISFEELLAQEKKDAFWQRNGRLKPSSS